MKKRIFHIAKELNISHTEIINFLKKKGLEISSHMMPVDEKTYGMILEEFSKDRLEIERFRKDKARKRVVEQNISLESVQETQVEPKENILIKETTGEEKPKKILSTPEATIKLKIIRKSDQSTSMEKPEASKKGSLTDRLKNLKKVDITSISDKINKSKRPAENKKGSSNLHLNKIISGSSKKPSKKKNKKSVDSDINDLNSDRKLLKLPEFITVDELAQSLSVSVQDIIKSCINLGLMVTINQRLDMDTIIMVSDEYGYDIETLEDATEESIDEDSSRNKGTDSRAPVVTIMGHVDHGKTSLLDYIRDTNVVAGESGSITQHIGAYEVVLENNKKITFLDTPGHSAFTAMRARGAKMTDIVIIVIAADSTVMPQTKEAINHSKVADVPIVFAINKIDTPNANVNKVKEDLSNNDILVEDWGGKYQCQEVSAKTGQGIDELLEKVLLEAELLELKANPKKKAVGTVVESELDKGRGYLTTIMVQGGTLNKGDIVLAGAQHGKVKALFDHRGKEREKVGPATPILMLGLNGAPQAGDKFNVFETDKEARELATKREQLIREQKLRTKKHVTLDEIGRRLALGNFKELNIVLKGDVDGSIEALSDSMEKLSTDEISVNIIHRGVGQITESDVLLASASDAIIIGFQVRPSVNARDLAEKEGIDIRSYSIIYEAINEIKNAMEGMLEPTEEEKIMGNVEVRETYKISKIGTIAGCFVTNGNIIRKNKIRLIRDGIVIFTGKIKQLKRFKEDANEVKSGYECGISIEDFNDIKVGDVIESFEIQEIKRKL